MPLPPAAARRQPLHTRSLVMRGYRREDGLYDIEGQLTDTKTAPFETMDRGRIAPGEPLHGMWLRLTVDETMLIHDVEAASDHTPYAICPAAAANFKRLRGLRIGPGFTRAVRERVGGVAGCTHLREMLGQLATVAYQTIGGQSGGGSPELIGTCLAWAADGPVVRARYPEAAQEAAAAKPAAAD
ncbi:DUF2889 domain-containing protein [Caldovatus aquaticus]|uniref:DUF2889 domain-containing protein n=1 Tax=Caldovatus aquaticus TaxID=2865671 RepID=A0ABS7F717_9PROT|nr:DUF2889 domain-containing protein [Caldovatus aquaticus]MBW8271422.1 DUF2889 domain-containing protein [Caldovatus aquaticus]